MLGKFNFAKNQIALRTDLLNRVEVKIFITYVRLKADLTDRCNQYMFFGCNIFVEFQYSWLIFVR